MPDLQVFSPADGQLLPLEQVPDPAFSEKMLGDGIAVNPSAGFVAAPFDGQVVSLHSALHAIAVRGEGAEALIHVGVETVNLQGKGFKACVKEGDFVKKGQKLTEFDPVFLAQNAPCNWVILIITSPDGAELKKSALTQVHAGQDVVFTLPGVQTAAAQPQTQAVQNWLYSREVRVPNPNGLHARPAGNLAEEAKKYPFSIQVEVNGKHADAKSLVSMMGLSIQHGDTVRLRAPQEAAEAAAALENLASKIEGGLGETEAEAAAVVHTLPSLPAADLSQPGSTLHALTACTGIALGPAWTWQEAQLDFEETAQDPAAEQQRLQAALQAVLADCARQIAAAPNKAAAEILHAHEELLQDPFLAQQAQEHLQQGQSAPAAFNEAIRASIDVLKKTKNTFLMERIADLKDLRSRVLTQLTGQTPQAPQIPDGCILVAQELLPSDISAFDGRVRGVLLAQGSPTAHASILLRNQGIPSLVGAGEAVLSIPDAEELALNATEGLAYFRPTEEQKQQLARLQAQEKQAQERNRQNASQPAQTQDGVLVHVCGNAGNEKEAAAAYANGADGLGLVRTEFLFYQGPTAPTQAQQYALYQSVADALHGRPVTLRTLDVGGDKPVSYMPLPPEDNPIVGLRGVRNYRQYRALFTDQIRAMLRVQPTGVVRIMLPMVSFVDELVEYKQFIEEQKKALGLSARVEIGIMVEVPSAALCAKQLAKEADFFSLGTNDLTQYTLAIDRGHKTLCAQADPLHPAVLELIARTCQGAQAYQRPVAVCGAMAGDLAAVPLLVGLGVRELAVGAGAIAQVKALVRTLNSTHCAQVAAQACQLDSAAQVRALVKKEFDV